MALLSILLALALARPQRAVWTRRPCLSKTTALHLIARESKSSKETEAGVLAQEPKSHPLMISDFSQVIIHESASYKLLSIPLADPRDMDLE